MWNEIVEQGALVFQSNMQSLNVKAGGTYSNTVRRDRAMCQVASRRVVISEARVRSQASQCVVCGWQSGTGTGLSPSTRGFLC